MWHVKTTIMKLELKHLIYQNYRPISILFKNGSIDLIASIDFEYGSVSFLNSNRNRLLEDNAFMLLLHPLSDLTKEIEVNGNKFVPINELKKDYSGFFFESNPEISIKIKNTAMYISLAWTNEIQQKLLLWHFDIFGLIDAGLAVDINTVK